MTMQSIREYYDVPAKRGMEIVYDGIPVVIVGSTPDAMHLTVRRVGSSRQNRVFRIHPTWRVEYPTDPATSVPGIQQGEKP